MARLPHKAAASPAHQQQRRAKRRRNAAKTSHVSGRRWPGSHGGQGRRITPWVAPLQRSSESDISGLPLDNMEFDISPSSSCCHHPGAAPPSWVGSSSSTDSGEMQEELQQDGYRVKRSRLYPNSEVIEQHCLKPSVARALFHQMELASCRGGKSTKYSWQVKKKKKSHSIPWHSNYADNTTGQYPLLNTLSVSNSNLLNNLDTQLGVHHV